MISIITPLHEPGNKYITEAYKSLTDQTITDWEWVIVENNGGKLPDSIRADPRVVVLTSDSGNIGALKKLACEAATLPYLLELDADDLLETTALEWVYSEFQRGADFVYSDSAHFGHVSNYPYSPEYGWESYQVRFRDSMVTAMKCPQVTAHNIRLIYWAPDHLRAWKKSIYLLVGGHDASMPVADDHDLIVRLWLAGAIFHPIAKCLYFYRVHESNTVKTKNAQIQDATWGVYNRYITQLAEHFADSYGLAKVDLCGGFRSPKGYIPIDKAFYGYGDAPGIICNLDHAWKLHDNSVGVLRAADAIEHLKNPIHTMNEAYRVLAPGGFFMIEVPSTNGKGAFCDPTHVSFWNELSFRYYTHPEFARFVPEFVGRFQTLRVIEWFPSEWHKTNNVPYVQAHLVALKPGYKPMGLAWR